MFQDTISIHKCLVASENTTHNSFLEHAWLEDWTNDQKKFKVLFFCLQETAMGLVLKAIGGRGWITGSRMEGPAISADPNENTQMAKKCVYPWSLFTKSPLR